MTNKGTRIALLLSDTCGAERLREGCYQLTSGTFSGMTIIGRGLSHNDIAYGKLAILYYESNDKGDTEWYNFKKRFKTEGIAILLRESSFESDVYERAQESLIRFEIEGSFSRELLNVWGKSEYLYVK